MAAILVAPLVLLTACGGGGGGDATPTATNPPPTTPPVTTPPPTAAATLVITSANAKPTAADALDNTTNLGTAQVGSAFVTGVQIDAGGTGGNAALQLAAVTRTLLDKLPARPALATGVFVNDATNCSLNGAITIQADVANQNALTVGDTILLGANSCREVVNGVTTELNGLLRLTVTGGGVSANASGFPIHVVLKIEPDTFTVAIPGKTTRTSGDMTLDLTAGSSTAESLIVSGTSLTSTVNTDVGARSFTLQNYRQLLSTASGGTTFSVTAQVSSTNSRLGTGTQVYSVSTPAPLVTNTSGSFTSGSLKVSGNASALLVTVTGTDTFQLQVDANGDGTFETTAPATRAELRSLL